MFFFFFKQKTAYEMRISDWSSDVCSSDLLEDADRERSRRVSRADRAFQLPVDRRKPNDGRFNEHHQERKRIRVDEDGSGRFFLIRSRTRFDLERVDRKSVV